MTKFFNFLLLFTLISNKLNSQNYNSYKFLEPAFSIKYDSNEFKIGNNYFNHFENNGNYEFKYIKDSIENSRILITTFMNISKTPTKKFLDSILNEEIIYPDNYENEKLKLFAYDKKMRLIKNFYCTGLVSFIKAENKYITIILTINLSENYYSKVDFYSSDSSLEVSYIKLEKFLNGFKVYSNNEILKADNLVKSKYTVKVIQAKKVIHELKDYESTFQGTLKINERINHKIKEIRLGTKSKYQIFEPNKNNETFIYLIDKAKGKIYKTGEIVFLNSIGKEVAIPFKFSYINKGLFHKPVYNATYIYK